MEQLGQRLDGVDLLWTRMIQALEPAPRLLVSSTGSAGHGDEAASGTMPE